MSRNAICVALDQYQSWTVTTAQYPEALAHPYLALGLGDEAGELLEKTASLASELSVPTALGRYIGVIDEAGDVMWYLAQSLLKRGMQLSYIYELAQARDRQFHATLLCAAVEVSVGCSLLQGREKKAIRDGKFDEARYVDAAVRVVQGLEAIARVFGFTFLDLLDRNMRKLSKRLDEGTIKGEGDAR